MYDTMIDNHFVTAGDLPFCKVKTDCASESVFAQFQ